MVKYIDDNATIRNAGDVLRYHTRKVLHRQDVANHSWNVARIYTQRYGIPRAEVYVYIIYHDVLEIITGDIPFQIKRNVANMKTACMEAELYAATQLDDMMFVDLTERELKRVKICDLLEMKEYAEIEIAHGNSLAADIVININTALSLMEDTPDVEIG